MEREPYWSYMGRRLREEKMIGHSIHDLELENKLLKENVHELRGCLQDAYIRIKELTNPAPKQLEFDI